MKTPKVGPIHAWQIIVAETAPKKTDEKTLIHAWQMIEPKEALKEVKPNHTPEESTFNHYF